MSVAGEDSICGGFSTTLPPVAASRINGRRLPDWIPHGNTGPGRTLDPHRLHRNRHRRERLQQYEYAYRGRVALPVLQRIARHHDLRGRHHGLAGAEPRRIVGVLDQRTEQRTAVRSMHRRLRVPFYTVSSYLTGCRTDATVSVNVTPLPCWCCKRTTICYGDAATLVVSGATSYQWSPAIALNTTSGGTVVESCRRSGVHRDRQRAGLQQHGQYTGTRHTASGHHRTAGRPFCSNHHRYKRRARRPAWSPTAGLLNTSGASDTGAAGCLHLLHRHRHLAGLQQFGQRVPGNFPDTRRQFPADPVSGCAPCRSAFSICRPRKPARTINGRTTASPIPVVIRSCTSRTRAPTPFGWT